MHNRNFTPFPAYLKELFQHKTKHNFEKAKLETEIFFYEHDKKVFVIISTYIVTIVKLQNYTKFGKNITKIVLQK